MPEKVIPIRSAAGAPPAPAWDGAPFPDTLGRTVRDLRISVTDRCNFRCVYCMPREVFDADHKFLPHSAILTFEDGTKAPPPDSRDTLSTNLGYGLGVRFRTPAGPLAFDVAYADRDKKVRAVFSVSVAF